MKKKGYAKGGMKKKGYAKGGAVSLRTYLNNQIKAKGSSLAKEKAKASKYKSIAAAKKAGALYYTNKDGKVMAAVYADDLKKSKVKPIPRPKPRPGAGKRPKVETRVLSPHTTGGGRGDGKIEMEARKKAKKKPDSKLVEMAVIAISSGKEPTGKAARIAKLKAEMRRLRTKIANARQKGSNDRRAEARIREIQGIIKRMNK